MFLNPCPGQVAKKFFSRGNGNDNDKKQEMRRNYKKAGERPTSPCKPLQGVFYPRAIYCKGMRHGVSRAIYGRLKA